MTTYTPRPWKAHANGRWVIDDQGYQIVYAASAIPTDVAKANTNLIATAPDGLALAEAVTFALGPETYLGRLARELIAKAGG